jgi:tRNA-modifying protein YgfZ
MTQGMLAADRKVLAVSGEDAEIFLQNLVTNDVARIAAGSCVYAALLSPQGKYLFDFFVVPAARGFLLDVKADRAVALAQRLSMYKLRAKVSIADAGLQVVQGLGGKPDGAVTDPRSPVLGWRAWTSDADAFLAGMTPLDPAEWQKLRIAAGVPETGIELLPDESYILEMGFEQVHGVDFRKGCYVGQEVTARMKHKSELRKGMIRVAVEGDPPAPGTPILSGGKPAGTLFSTAGGIGLAYLRFDRATGALEAGTARLRLEDPSEQV